jgi:hypothetical protein
VDHDGLRLVVLGHHGELLVFLEWFSLDILHRGLPMDVMITTETEEAQELQPAISFSAGEHADRIAQLLAQGVKTETTLNARIIMAKVLCAIISFSGFLSLILVPFINTFAWLSVLGLLMALGVWRYIKLTASTLKRARLMELKKLQTMVEMARVYSIRQK